MIVSTGLGSQGRLLTKTDFGALLIDSLNCGVCDIIGTDCVEVKASAIPNFSEEWEGWNSYGRARWHGGTCGARRARCGRGGGQIAQPRMRN